MYEVHDMIHDMNGSKQNQKRRMNHTSGAKKKKKAGSGRIISQRE